MSYHSGNQLIDPALIFEKCHLHEGMHVADLGCGRTGHIIFPAAMMIGEQGIVYAVDILKDVLENIQNRAKQDNFVNVHTVWSDLEKVGYTAIPRGSLDVVFLINSLVQTADKFSVLDEAMRLLKDKSRLVIVDWCKKCQSIGPEEKDFINFDVIKEYLSKGGLYLQEEFESGPYHKGLVFYKHD